MKKIIGFLLILLLACFAVAEIDYILKPVKYSTPASKIAYMELLYAKRYGNDFIIYVNMFNADSVLVSNHNYFLDRRAPFQLGSQEELDSLLIWHQYYK